MPALIILVGVAFYLALIFFKKEPPSIETKVKVWPVNVMSVKLKSHAPVLTIYGVVENPGALKITAPGSTYVTQLPVSEGQIVKQGELLIELDQRDFLPKLQSAAADISKVEAQLANLKLRHEMDRSTLKTENKVLKLKQLELSRTELLKHRKLGSQVAVDQAQQALQTQTLAVAQRQFSMQEYPHKIKELNAQLKQAQADYSLAKLELERSKKVADTTVIVGRINVAVGDRVEQNQSLFVVYPFNTMQVRAKIPTPYVSAVQSALVTNKQIFKPLTAQAEGYDIELDLNRLAGEADTRGIDALLIASANPEQLRTGMALTIYLSLPEHTDSLVIPYQALYGVDRAYTVVDGRLHGIVITRLGDVPSQDGVMWALVKSRSLSDGDLLVTTHLPNAVNGLVVEPRPMQP